MEITPFERDIIGWLQQHCEDIDVRRQIPHMVLCHREYTGVGFFLHFSIPSNVTPAPDSAGDVSPFPGPEIASPELETGAGSVIFLTDGIIDCIEVFAYGNSFPETLVDYRLT